MGAAATSRGMQMPNQSSERVEATLKFEDGKATKGVAVLLTGRGFVIVCDTLRGADNALGARVTLVLAGTGMTGE